MLNGAIKFKEEKDMLNKNDLKSENKNNNILSDWEIIPQYKDVQTLNNIADIMSDWQVVEDTPELTKKHSKNKKPALKNNMKKDMSDWDMVMDFKEDPNLEIPKGFKPSITYYKETINEQVMTDADYQIKRTKSAEIVDKMKFTFYNRPVSDKGHLESRAKIISEIVDFRLSMFRQYYMDKYRSDSEKDVKTAEQQKEYNCLVFLKKAEEYTKTLTDATKSKTEMYKAMAQKNRIDRLIEETKNDIEKLKDSLDSYKNKKTEDAKSEAKLIKEKLEFQRKKLTTLKKKQISPAMLRGAKNNYHEKFTAELNTAAYIKTFMENLEKIPEELQQFLEPLTDMFIGEFREGEAPPKDANVIDYSSKKIIKSEIDTKKSTKNNIEYKPVEIVMNEISSTLPLFPHEPVTQDICQGNIGDCYFLSALVALVNKSPTYIQDMMHDNGDGTVTVRFYRYNKKEDATKPVYYKIKKQIPSTKSKLFFNSAMWVYLLETAYAAFRGDIIGENHGFFRNGYMKTRRNIDFSAIEGGTDEEAFAAITGKTITKYSMDTTYTEKGKIKTLKRHIKGYYRYESTGKTEQVDENISENTSGEYFQNKYSDYANYIFDTIQDNLKEGNIMLAGSYDKADSIFDDNLIESVAQKNNNAADERVDDSGLLARHEYTVLDAYSDPITNIKYVVVRNPWGLHTNQYFVDKNKTVFSHYTDTSDDEGVCVVELNQFVHRFRDFSAMG